MTLDCVGLTEFSVVRMVHRNVSLKHFFHLPKFLLLSLAFAYIYISQGSVEMHLSYGGICNNHIIANCLQIVVFYGLRCICIFLVHFADVVYHFC